MKKTSQEQIGFVKHYFVQISLRITILQIKLVTHQIHARIKRCLTSIYICIMCCYSTNIDTSIVTISIVYRSPFIRYRLGLDGV